MVMIYSVLYFAALVSATTSSEPADTRIRSWQYAVSFVDPGSGDLGRQQETC